MVLICLLSGCGRENAEKREMLTRLDAIQTELAKQQRPPLRWAYANRRELQSAVYTVVRDRMAAFNKSEQLTAEVTQQIQQYDALRGELMHQEMEAAQKRMNAMRWPRPPSQPASAPIPQPPPGDDLDIKALREKVAAAKAPVASFIDRRNHQEATLREQFKIDRLVADYVKGRYDLVVDSTEKQLGEDAALYHTGSEVPDITQGIIAYLEERAQ